MEQRIVIEVRNCKKCRSKAMKIVAVAKGVNSVALEGKDKDQVVVIGERVDSACLTNKLRKKVGYARLISVQEEKGKVKPETENKDKCCEPKNGQKEPWIPCYVPCQPYPMYEVVVYDPSPPGCTIM